MDKKQLQALEKVLDYEFKDKVLLELALTHRSFHGSNNERLEFLGDSILNFIVAELLFRKFSDLDEGDLSRLRSQLVNESTLSEIGVAINIGEYLKLGEGELKSAGWRRPSIMADGLEAIIGALFMDGGIDASHLFITKSYQDRINSINPREIHKDPKSILQEFLQSKKIALPSYEIISIEGEAHSQFFKVNCLISEFKLISEGEGTSRKVAEQMAAQVAMKMLKKNSNDN
ncbi:MAG: ribonuclease III [Methylophilaceae bacterium]